MKKKDRHEGSVVFEGKRKCRILTNKWNGLDVYVSDDAKNWNFGTEPTEDVELIPMGAARLRVSAFPMVD